MADREPRPASGWATPGARARCAGEPRPPTRNCRTTPPPQKSTFRSAYDFAPQRCGPEASKPKHRLAGGCAQAALRIVLQVGQCDDGQVEIVGISAVEDGSDEQRTVDAHGEISTRSPPCFDRAVSPAPAGFPFLPEFEQRWSEARSASRAAASAWFLSASCWRRLCSSLRRLVHFVLRLDQLLPHAVQLAGELVEVAVQLRIVGRRRSGLARARGLLRDRAGGAEHERQRRAIDGAGMRFMSLSLMDWK